MKEHTVRNIPVLPTSNGGLVLMMAPCEEDSPKQKRKPREIRWTPTSEEDEQIRDYQEFKSICSRRPNRAQVVSGIMRLGWISWDHQVLKWRSRQPVEEEPQEEDNRTPLQQMDALLVRIKAKLPEIEALLERIHGKWGEEDSIYRFYHHSLKAFLAQKVIEHGYKILKEIGEGRQLNRWYEQIYKAGLAFQFHVDRSNANW